MPNTNKIIKLNSINRHTVDNQQCILLDNQQDALGHIGRLALVPAKENINPDGSREVSYPARDIILLNQDKGIKGVKGVKEPDDVKKGLFPIGFHMQTDYGYLVLGIVPPGVITGLNNDGNFQVTDASAAVNESAEHGQYDPQVVREWLPKHQDWIQTNGIIIYA